MAYKRLALCVGLNYPRTPAALSGCVNDAEDWKGVLDDRGYAADVFTEPTKAELVDALRSMLSKARFGDRVVLTFSGHGTRVPDADGDEADGWDEALVCADYQNGGVLTDDELHQIFGAVPYGVRRTVLSDSCYSASVTRFAPVFAGKAGNLVPRSLPQVAFMDGRQLEVAKALEDRAAPVNSPPRKGVVLISGCEDDKYSYDATFGGRPNGAFTFHAIAALRGTYNVVGWHRAIRTRLPSADYPQAPQLTALKHQRYWQAL